MAILKAQPCWYSGVPMVLGSALAIADLLFFFERSLFREFRDGGGDPVRVDAL